MYSSMYMHTQHYMQEVITSRIYCKPILPIRRGLTENNPSPNIIYSILLTFIPGVAKLFSINRVIIFSPI